MITEKEQRIKLVNSTDRSLSYEEKSQKNSYTTITLEDKLKLRKSRIRYVLYEAKVKRMTRTSTGKLKQDTGLSNLLLQRFLLD